MHRRLRLLIFAVAAFAAVLFVSLAAAKPPTHTTNPFSGTVSCDLTTCTNPDASTSPAFCDFAYSQVFSGTDEVSTFSDGRVLVHEKLQVKHTNVGTGFSLTESDQINVTFYANGGAKEVGVFWHLRDASGKMVVVHAGQIVFDDQFNVVKFTPNSGPDFAAVICPALGGNPV